MNKIHNKIIKIVMSFALTLGVILGVAGSFYEKTSADTDDSNFTNLIIFMRFADEDEFIDDVYEYAGKKNNGQLLQYGNVQRQRLL